MAPTPYDKLRKILHTIFYQIKKGSANHHESLCQKQPDISLPKETNIIEQLKKSH